MVIRANIFFISYVLIALIFCACSQPDENPYDDIIIENIVYECVSEPINWYIKGKMNDEEFCYNHLVDGWEFELSRWNGFTTTGPFAVIGEEPSDRISFMCLEIYHRTKYEGTSVLGQESIRICSEEIPRDSTITYDFLLNKWIALGNKKVAEHSDERNKGYLINLVHHQYFEETMSPQQVIFTTREGDQEKDARIEVVDVHRDTIGGGAAERVKFKMILDNINIYRANQGRRNVFWGELTDCEILMEIERVL